jgi:hypothetical protein
MRRRNFIALVGGAAAWPLAARAQQQTKLPTIGFLGASTAASWTSWTAAFVQRLRELGWSDRVSMGGRAARALRRNRRRVRPPQGRCHRQHGRQRLCVEAGDAGHPDRFRGGQ